MNDSNISTAVPGRSKRATLLLAIGASLGFLLAVSGLLEPGAPDTQAAVASVNDFDISKEEYLAYLSMLARDKRNPLTDSDRRHILNRMIEEKLLVSRGIDIGLAETDPNIRKVISTALIETIIADSSIEEPDIEELKNFYQRNQQYFARAPRLQLQRIVFRDDKQQQALQKARAAAQALAEGKDFASVKRQWGSPEVLKISALFIV